MEQNTMTKQDPVTIKNTLVKDHKAHYSYNLTNKASAQMESKMKAITGGINIPGLF